MFDRNFKIKITIAGLSKLSLAVSGNDMNCDESVILSGTE